MKLSRILLICITIVFFSYLGTNKVLASNEKSSVYVFGIAMSFNDSVLYMTPVQMLDSVYLTNNNFLYSRENYSYQLRNYVKGLGIEQPTCITVFSEKKKKIEKKYSKIRKKYSEKDKFIIKYLATDEFQYVAILPEEGIEGLTKADKKAAKKTKKEQLKAKKAENKENERLARERAKALKLNKDNQ